MATMIRRVDYFYANVKDTIGAGYGILSELADQGVNLVAFTAIPIGPTNIQMVLFPDDSQGLVRAASKGGLVLTGPQQALLVQGDDRLGALAEIHRKLYDARIDLYAASAVTSGEGHYGYVLYVKPEQFESAARALEV